MPLQGFCWPNGVAIHQNYIFVDSPVSAMYIITIGLMRWLHPCKVFVDLTVWLHQNYIFVDSPESATSQQGLIGFPVLATPLQGFC